MATISSQALSAGTKNEEDRLLQLFWNRSALRKNFSALAREKFHLKDLLKQQEKRTLRAQKHLEHLENILSDPLRAANAVVFFQLRGVWNVCQKKLSRMAEELSVHQREREQKQITNRFENSRRASIESLDAHIAKTQQNANALVGKLKAIHDRHDQLRGFWNYFKRRALRAEMGPPRVSLSDVSDQLEQLKVTRKAKEEETGPELEKLSIKGQRKINLALIAISQEFYLHFSERRIASMAREASVRAVGDADFGGIKECRELSNHIDQHMQALLQSSQNLVASLHIRSAVLEKQVSYRGDMDLIPVAGSFAVIPPLPADGDHPGDNRSVKLNVLADEFWDIYTVLLS